MNFSNFALKIVYVFMDQMFFLKKKTIMGNSQITPRISLVSKYSQEIVGLFHLLY